MSSRQSATQVHIAPDTIPCILKCHPLVQAVGMQVIIFCSLIFCVLLHRSLSLCVCVCVCVCVCACVRACVRVWYVCLSIPFLSPPLSPFIHTHV